MKNVCVVFKKQDNGLFTVGETSVIKAFNAFGFLFDEIRFLYSPDEKKLCNAVNKLKDEYENILFLTARTDLLFVKTLLSSIFEGKTFQGTTNGAGIYGEKNKTLFLLSADTLDTGTGYAENVCVPYLMKKYGMRLDKLVIRCVGANENRVESLIAHAKSFDQGKMQYRYQREYDEDVIEIFYDETVPKMLVDDVLRIFADGLSNSVYALDDTPLEKQLVQLLKLRGRKISVAESFTGGALASRITSVSGASEVYFEGLNTYNELSKVNRLGVSEYTLNTVGAVSDQTAYEMAAGLIATGNCDISIATTGLAGPNSDKSMLPVGLCYIAIGVKERVFVYRYKFGDTREEITKKAINYALFLAYKQLKNM